MEGKHNLYYELLETLAEEGCPVCRIVRQAVAHYLDGVLYELVNEPNLRDTIRQARGFCRRHAWQLADLKDALGLSIIYRDLVREVLGVLGESESAPTDRPPGLAERISGRRNGRASAREIAATLAPRAQCPACASENTTARIYLETLAAHPTNAELLEAYRRSDGLCIPHLKQALEKVRGPEALESLLALERAKLKQLEWDLDEFLLKADYRQAGTAYGQEGNAWLRALRKLSGNRLD